MCDELTGWDYLDLLEDDISDDDGEPTIPNENVDSAFAAKMGWKIAAKS